MSAIVIPASILLSGCALGRNRPANYGRPFEVVTSSYMVPATVGLTLPDTVGGWNDSVTLERWIQGWTHRPVRRDSDAAIVNYVLHPLSGSETHILARDNGWTFWEALMFDVFGSVYWEYVFENLFESPSRTDLLTTGPLGAVLGELRWQGKQAGVAPGVLDPFGGYYVSDHGAPDPELVTGSNALLLNVFRLEF